MLTKSAADDRLGYAARTSCQVAVCKSSPGTVVVECTYSQCAVFPWLGRLPAGREVRGNHVGL